MPMSTLRFFLSSIVLTAACSGCAGTLGPTSDVSTVKLDRPGPERGGAAPLGASREPRAETPSTPEADVARITADAWEVTRYLAEKRRAQDVVWVLCLNDKLTQIHASQRLSVEYREGLRQAIERGDEQEAQHQRVKLGVLRERADRLVEESRQCV